MELLNRYKEELFSALENKELNKFRKTFLEFDNYVAGLNPATNTDRKYLKSCFDTFQELYTNVLLQQLVDFYKVLLVSKNNVLNLPHKVEQNLIIKTIHTNIDSILQFYNQEVLYAFFEYLQSLEQKHKVNLVIVGLAYLFSKDNLPGNLLFYALMKFEMPPGYYHYLIKIVSDFNGDNFFNNEEVVEKILFAFKMIDSKKADEVICTIGQLAVDREAINMFKAIQKALDNGNIETKGSKFTGDMLKYYLTRFNAKNNNVKAVFFLNKTLLTTEKSTTKD